MPYGRKNGGGTQVVHKWSLFENFNPTYSIGFSISIDLIICPPIGTSIISITTIDCIGKFFAIHICN